MATPWRSGLALLALSAAFASAATAADDGQAFIGPKDLKWGPAPPSLPAGAQVAVLRGDPGKPGPFAIRIKMPAGYKIAPHWHPKRENVTVISGTFKVGMGDTFDESKMATFPAGSFAYLDPDMHHYAIAADAVVVQIHGTAPVQFNYVNPQDDPSKK